MNAHTHETQQLNGNAERRERNQLVGGAVMLFAGLAFLLSQIFTLGAWFLIILGLGFTVAGVYSHGAHWFIPGGIIGGIGLGALLTELGLAGGDPAQGGLFLVAFAAGWASITLLTRLFAERTLTWPLIPGAILALIGGALLLGEAGVATLETFFLVLGYAWPLALIAGGVALIARARRQP